MLVNPFETSVDLRNLIFEKTQELVRTVSALNGSRLELLDFADECKCSDDFHKWVMTAALMRTSENITECTLLCNQIFDILRKCDELLEQFEDGATNETD